jgi:hypothetical protein
MLTANLVFRPGHQQGVLVHVDPCRANLHGRGRGLRIQPGASLSREAGVEAAPNDSAARQELIELKREIRDGMYSPLSFVIANTILQVSLAAMCFDSARSLSPFSHAEHEVHAFLF